MTGWAGLATASFLAGWVLVLLGCGVAASPDTELLMQAPFASSLNWTSAAELCNPSSSSPAANIVCDVDDNVIQLVISVPSSAAAEITLPPEWGSLTHLVNLTVSGAAGGVLPPEWGTDGSFPNLEQLMLDDISLSGSLPEEWGNGNSFPRLQVLNLNDNTLSGSLPPGWGRNGSFSQLQRLQLYNNFLTGSLPPGWGSKGSFPKLQRLFLYNNYLNGSLPAGWSGNGSFPHLELLRLGDNSLSGSLPAEWGSDGSFPKLQDLWLYNNSLSGSLPAVWGSNSSFAQLESLGLSNNSLSGSLPEQWGCNGSFPQLQQLWLSNNFLSGSLLPGWGRDGCFPQLQELYLYNNSLSGSLPAGWGSTGSFPHLRELWLANNLLSGSLPARWGSAGSFPVLQILGLTNNSLSGSFPAGWGTDGSFPQLQRLWLSDNYLGGSLPAGWGSGDSFHQLQLLDLSFNSLSGSLPTVWGRNGSFHMLWGLSLASNNLSGGLPATWGVPVKISIPALQGVPESIKALPFNSIMYLGLWNNSFTGGIPLEWTNNPNFLSGRVVLDDSLFRASKESPDFAKGICTDPYRYDLYRNWSIEILQADECAQYMKRGDFISMPDHCFIQARKTDLDPCALDSETKIALIALWSCFSLIVLMICLGGRAVALLDRHFPRFQESRNSSQKLIEHMMTGHRGILLGMVAALITFWADIASDVPVLMESVERKGPYFYVLLALMLGSHILDAILIATNAVVNGEKGPGPTVVSGALFSRASQNAAMFMMCFFLAIIALPAMDVMCLVKGGKGVKVDAIFGVDIEGYQAMRLVIGSVFRTIPTAVVLTVIAALGNNPNNGTYFDAKVVSVSLSLSALHIIVAIIQVHKLAAKKQMTKLQMLSSVFTLNLRVNTELNSHNLVISSLKGLARPVEEDPSPSSKDKGVEAESFGTAKDAQSDLKGCPFCEGTGLFRQVEKEP